MDVRNIITNHIKGATFIGMDTETPVTLKGGKTNPLQGRVTKQVNNSNVMLFQNKTVNGYDNMVRRRLEKEGKDADAFQLGPRAWGIREDGMPFIHHNGKMYLEVIFLNAGDVKYFVDGNETPKEAIQGLDTDKAEGEQGGLDNKVIIRTYNVDNIKAMRVDGKEYRD